MFKLEKKIQSEKSSIGLVSRERFIEPLAFAREYGGQKFFLQIKNFCISLQCKHKSWTCYKISNTTIYPKKGIV